MALIDVRVPEYRDVSGDLIVSVVALAECRGCSVVYYEVHHAMIWEMKNVTLAFTDLDSI